MWTARLLKALPACSTPYGNQRKITFLPSLAYTWDNLFVLNALRQSEENHEERLHGWKQQFEGVCSTPYGNQRKITG